jgi:hypothetical protein
MTSTNHLSSPRRRATPRSQWGCAVPVVSLLFLAGLATACGHGSAAPGVARVGSSSTPTSQAPLAAPATTVPTAASTAALTKFAACVRKQGLANFPDPPWGNGELDNLGFTKQVLEKYENGACQKYFLAAGGTIPTPAENQQRLEQLLKIAKCMRAHGIVDFPDPSSQGGFKIPVPVADEPGDTAAAKVCGAPPA